MPWAFFFRGRLTLHGAYRVVEIDGDLPIGGYQNAACFVASLAILRDLDANIVRVFPARLQNWGIERADIRGQGAINAIDPEFCLAGQLDGDPGRVGAGNFFLAFALSGLVPQGFEKLANSILFRLGSRGKVFVKDNASAA